jgi:hypothetical protein
MNPLTIAVSAHRPTMTVSTPRRQTEVCHVGQPGPPGAAWQFGPADHQLKAWSFDPMLADTTTGSIAPGALGCIRLRLVEAGPIWNVVLVLGTAGAGLTAGQCFAALYPAQTGGPLIGISTNQSTNWQRTGIVNMPLVGAPFDLPAGDYHVAYWANGTTPPALARHGGATVTTNLLQAHPDLGWGISAGAGLTDTAPATLPALTPWSLMQWAGVY